MKKQIKKANVETIQYRAHCLKNDYNGKWRNSKKEAREDAARHRAIPGNEKHLVKIEIEQTG